MKYFLRIAVLLMHCLEKHLYKKKDKDTDIWTNKLEWFFGMLYLLYIEESVGVWDFLGSVF